MKKVLAIAFIGGLLVANCSKKPDHDLQDSNTMLPEPDAPTMVDSAAKKPDSAAINATPAPQAPKTDSAAAK
ncbi:hypothetical protein ODZ84_21555 [Chryseobacterium fluminis]|uniref:hypothetical protein n=1 Tax=Chryseobacterium fluminis TaxID=2983606 RepID=UPI002259688A|nr:hypothetical protein [Chryseobacterium sp. MMS21-Ot14]UZT97728.1 hypothetical protein ODZ84_21555 [Chryseobacterium sp. MMS21-Ot14]